MSTLKNVSVVAGFALLAWISAIALGFALLHIRVPVSLPVQPDSGDLRALAQAGYVEVEGTWNSEGDQMAFPLQTSKVSCYRPTQLCHVATAEIGKRETMRVSLDIYKIETWSEKQVVFVDHNPICAGYTYTIDLETGVTTGVREKAHTASADCAAVHDKPRVLRLADGFTVHDALTEKAMPWFLRFALGRIG